MKASLKILRSVIGVIVAVLVWFGMESSIALRRAGSIGWEIVKKKKKNYSIVAHWVTTWDEDTTKLIADKSFPDLKDAEAYRIEQNEAADPPGRVYVVAIETLPLGEKPPQFRHK